MPLFFAVLLKDKILKPDIEGFPTLASEDGRVFLEFQGYSDPFIRQRLMAEVFMSCASEQYEEFVMAGIVYTDEKYQQDAKPLNTFNGFAEITDCRLNGCFQEIVLSDYTDYTSFDLFRYRKFHREAIVTLVFYCSNARMLE